MSSSSSYPTASPTSTTSSEAAALQAILQTMDSDETLCSLSDIKSVRAWDFSLPTLARPLQSSFTARNTYASDAPLFQAIQQHNGGVTHSILKAVGALEETPENHSVVLYGGALVDLVLRRESQIKDWDLRLVGKQFLNSQEKCLAAGRDFVDKILAWIRQENDIITIRNQKKPDHKREKLIPMERFTVSRASSTLTVTIPTRGVKFYELGIDHNNTADDDDADNEDPWSFGSGTKCSRDTVLQFTFAPYETVHQLFAGARPHCTRIAVWRNKVVLAPIARYCLESCCIVLDTASLTHCKLLTSKKEESSSDDWEALEAKSQHDSRARSLPLELERATQYFLNKGFDVILPDLDMAKVPRRNLKFGAKEVLDLPHLTVIFDEIQENKIVVDNVQVVVNPIQKDDTQDSSGSKAESASSALRHYQHEGYASATDLNSGGVIHHNLRCLIAGIHYKYQFFTEGEVVDPVFDYCPKLTPRMVQFAFQTVRTKFGCASESFPIQVVLQYFAATPPDQVIEKLVMVPVKKLAGSGRHDGTATSTPVHGTKFELDEAALREIIRHEEQDVIQNKLPFMREKMIAAGLNKFNLSFPQKNYTSEEAIAKALYGQYHRRQPETAAAAAATAAAASDY